MTADKSGRMWTLLRAIISVQIQPNASTYTGLSFEVRLDNEWKNTANTYKLLKVNNIIFCNGRVRDLSQIEHILYLQIVKQAWHSITIERTPGSCNAYWSRTIGNLFYDINFSKYFCNPNIFVLKLKLRVKKIINKKNRLNIKLIIML